MLLCKSPGLGDSGPSCVGLAKLVKLPGKSLWLAQFDLPTHSGERDQHANVTFCTHKGVCDN